MPICPKWTKKHKLVSLTCPVCGVTCMARKTNKFCSKRCGKLRPVEDRFWEKVNKQGGDQCWEWLAARQSDGYGTFNFAKPKTMLAHRVAFLLTYGDLPPDKEICHSCDNPPCVRPDHLFVGTHLENMQDSAQKGRRSRSAARGERNGGNKYPAETILEIRRLAGTATYNQIAQLTGVSAPLVSLVVNRKIWKHLP